MLKGIKFHYKLFVSFSIFVFIILTLSGIMFYIYTVSIIERNIADSQRQTTQKLQEQLDAMLSEMDSISLAVNSSDYIMSVLKNIPHDPENNYFDKNPRINDDVKSALYSFTALKPIDGRLSLISKDYDYTDLNNKFNNQIVTKEFIGSNPMISQFMASDKYKIFLPPHQDEWSLDKDIVFSLLRPIRDNYDIFGLVEISRNIKDIDNICTFKDTSKKNYVAIIDANRNLIYNNFGDKFKIDEKLIYNDIISSSTIGSYIINNAGEKTKVSASFSKLSNVNWTVIQLEDMET
jgi:two-component system, sensor histidine kinase YesM